MKSPELILPGISVRYTEDYNSNRHLIFKFGMFERKIQYSMLHGLSQYANLNKVIDFCNSIKEYDTYLDGKTK